MFGVVKHYERITQTLVLIPNDITFIELLRFKFACIRLVRVKDGVFLYSIPFKGFCRILCPGDADSKGTSFVSL